MLFVPLLAPLHTTTKLIPAPSQSTEFSAGQRLPASIVMHHKEDHYAIDADKSMDAGILLNILADYVRLFAHLCLPLSRS